MAKQDAVRKRLKRDISDLAYAIADLKLEIQEGKWPGSQKEIAQKQIKIWQAEMYNLQKMYLDLS